MIYDNLIDNIIKRAEEYFDNLDCINSCKYYQRALRRVFNTIEEECMKSMKEYEEKYDIGCFVDDVVQDYLISLDDCFQETGDKSYLENIIQFKEKNIHLYKNDEYMYLTLLRSEIEAIFYLGNIEKSFEMYKKLIENYPKNDTNYFNMARLYYENNEIEKAIKLLKIGIQKCSEGKEDMRDRLYMYEEELKEDNRKKSNVKNNI